MGLLVLHAKTLSSLQFEVGQADSHVLSILLVNLVFEQHMSGNKIIYAADADLLNKQIQVAFNSFQESEQFDSGTLTLHGLAVRQEQLSSVSHLSRTGVCPGNSQRPASVWFLH